MLLTLADAYALTYVMFYHWRCYLWSWAWKIPPIPPTLLRLQESPVVTTPTSRTSISWVPNHLPGPNNVCTCYLLYHKSLMRHMISLYLIYKWRNWDTKWSSDLFKVTERGAEPGVKPRQSDFRVWIQLEWIWYIYMLVILTNFFN